MKKRTKIILLAITLLLGAAFIIAKVKHIRPLSWGTHNKINQAVFSDEAINGYDPVAYFKVQKAIKGKPEYSYEWNNATWYFASEENLNLFKSKPESYAPQFGGYCAFAVSKGFTANSDPDVFTVIDGKLYLCSEKKLLDEWVEGDRESLNKSKENWNQ